MKPLLLLVSLVSPVFSAITFTLPGSTEQSSWVLGSANYPTTTYRSFGTAALAWGAEAAPTSGTSSALLSKVSGSGYMSGAGFMYTAGTVGTFSITDSSPLASLQTVVFQGGISDPFDSGYPILNYNGGTQALPAGFFLQTPDTPYPYEDRAWQWDLSGIAGTITSYEIVFSGHFAASTLRVNTSDSFLQVIPEPSTGLLGLAALGLTLIRHRRA